MFPFLQLNLFPSNKLKEPLWLMRLEIFMLLASEKLTFLMWSVCSTPSVLIHPLVVLLKFI